MRVAHPSASLAAFAVASIEYVHGRRSLVHFAPWCSPQLLLELPRHRLPRTGTSTTDAPPLHLTPGSVRVCLLDDTTAEACVVVHQRQRLWVVSMRLETHHGRWRVTELEYLSRPQHADGRDLT